MIRDEDTSNAAILSKYLGDSFKFLTRNQSDMILLESEIEHAKTYVEIQRMRFSSRIDFDFEIYGDH